LIPLLNVSSIEQMHGRAPPATGNGGSDAFGPADPMIDFAYFCMREQLVRLDQSRPPAGEAPTPDEVHQTRIAVRRIRAALRLFAGHLPPVTTRRLNDEFRWLGRRLGEVRDLDVQTARVAKEAKPIPKTHQVRLAPYERFLQTERDQARAALESLFTSERFVALIGRFRKFVSAGPSAAQRRRHGGLLIGEAAPRHLAEESASVIARGAKISDDSRPGKLHSLRIHCKRLRYQFEFFMMVYPRALASAAKSAKRMQDFLGEYQDVCTARKRLKRYAKTQAAGQAGAGQLIALGRLMQRQEEHARALRRQFPQQWSRFRRKVDGDWVKILAQTG
jgi:triphosphatase